MHKVFVGGPIQYALNGNSFSASVKAALEHVITEVERAGYEVLSAHRVEEYGKVDSTGLEHEICNRDFNWMKECDVFIAVLPALEDTHEIVRTDGTCVELGWASALGKNVFIVKSMNHTYSHLLEGLSACNQNVVKVDIDEVLNGTVDIIEMVKGVLAKRSFA